jgi:hypothetical protein
LPTESCYIYKISEGADMTDALRVALIVLPSWAVFFWIAYKVQTKERSARAIANSYEARREAFEVEGKRLLLISIDRRARRAAVAMCILVGATLAFWFNRHLEQYRLSPDVVLAAPVR